MKKSVFWMLRKHTLIFCVVVTGQRNPYQLKNAIKVVGQFFATITWTK